MMKSGMLLSPSADMKLDGDARAFNLAGDESEFGDQFSSQLIRVGRNRDYLVSVQVDMVSSKASVKVVSADRRVTLASAILAVEPKRGSRKQRKGSAGQAGASATESTEASIRLPFASGQRDEVRLVVSNNGRSPDPALVRIGRVRMFDLEPTPFMWTRYPRVIVRGLQKNLFTTSRMLPFVFAGLALRLFSRSWKPLALLLVTPLYYLCVQSALHTEYRDILVVHYFLFVLAGVATSFAAMLVLACSRLLIASLKLRVG